MSEKEERRKGEKERESNRERYRGAKDIERKRKRERARDRQTDRHVHRPLVSCANSSSLKLKSCTGTQKGSGSAECKMTGKRRGVEEENAVRDDRAQLFAD